MTLSMNYQTRVPWPLALLASVALVGTAKADALPDFTKLVTQVSPAVVNISTTRTEGMVEQQGFPSLPDIPPDSPLNDFLKKFFKEQPGVTRGERKLPEGYESIQIARDTYRGLSA